MLLFSFISALANGGPDAHGMTWESTPYGFVSIGGSGLPLVLADDGEYDVALPFAFPFYGSTHTDVTVGANGALTFGQGAAIGFTNAPLPRTAPADPDIAVFWDDLDPATQGDVWTAQWADRFVISWEGVGRFGSAGDLTFQVHLFPSGRIEMHYADTDVGPGADSGTSATVGIQDKSGGSALSGNWLQVGYLAASVPSGTALAFDFGGSGCEDADGDGHGALACGGSDCADGDPTVHPGAFEQCDAVDHDCDGDLVDGFPDFDADGAPDCIDPPPVEDTDVPDDTGLPIDTDVPDTDPPVDTDVPDTDPPVDTDVPDTDVPEPEPEPEPIETGDTGIESPEPPEQPVQDVPDDTDVPDTDAPIPDPIDPTDPADEPSCEDCDGDGYTVQVDCNDADPRIYPGSVELLDGLDNDCNGRVDEAMGCGCQSSGSPVWVGVIGAALVGLRRRRRMLRA